MTARGALFERVQKGQKFKPRAATWNALMEMAEKWFSDQEHQGPPRRAPAIPAGPEDSVNVLVRNLTGADQPQFAILQPSAPLVTPAASLTTFAERRGVTGILPAAGLPFVVMQEPCAKNAIARAVCAGITPCKLNVVDANHKFAGPSVDPTQLTSAVSGPAEILWKDAGLGASIWALVKLCCDDGTPVCCPGFLGDPKKCSDCGDCGGKCGCSGGAGAGTKQPVILTQDCCEFLGSPEPCPPPGPGPGPPPPVGGGCPPGQEQCSTWDPDGCRALWCNDPEGWRLPDGTPTGHHLLCFDPKLSGTGMPWRWGDFGQVGGLGEIPPDGTFCPLTGGQVTTQTTAGGTGGGTTSQTTTGGIVPPDTLPPSTTAGGGGGTQQICQYAWDPSTLSYVQHCFDWPRAGGMPGGGDLGDGPLGGGSMGGNPRPVAVSVTEIYSATAGLVQVVTGGGLGSVITFTGSTNDVLRGDGTFGAAPGGAATPLTKATADLTAQTSTNLTAFTYTTAGGDQCFNIQGLYLNVTATGGVGTNITAKVTFTDPGSNAVSLTLAQASGGGQLSPAGVGWIFFKDPGTIRAKTGTAVAYVITATGGTPTFDVGGRLIQA